MNKEERQKELLLQLRGEMISKFKCEPFKILPDNVIDAIIEEQPTSMARLKKVKGLPAEGFRMKKYGEAIVSIIKNWARITAVEVIGNNDSGYTVDMVLKNIEAF